MVSCSFKARQRESQPIYFIFTIGQAIFCLITQKNKSRESPIQWGVEKHPLLISNACPRPGSFHLCVNVIATSTKILITLRKWFSSNMRNNQTTTNASWHTRQAISAGTACISLQRGLPRQPGPQSHRTDWRNNNQSSHGHDSLQLFQLPAQHSAAGVLHKFGHWQHLGQCQIPQICCQHKC